jgi:hypothetical protein
MIFEHAYLAAETGSIKLKFRKTWFLESGRNACLSRVYKVD